MIRGGAERVGGFYATLLEGLSIQARDGASRLDLEAIIDGAMTAWDPLVACGKTLPGR